MRRVSTAPAFVAALGLFSVPRPAFAGMPSFSFTEVAEARIEAISFFLLCFALSALILRWSWNALAKDFAWMPRLRYAQAFGALVVSGLFVYVALSFIAGARELMTPGAWVRTGATHRLVDLQRDPGPWLASARVLALERLRDELWNYSKENEGRLPASRDRSGIDESVWAGLHPQGDPFVYFPRRLPGTGSQIVACEPESYGRLRYALSSDGEILKLGAKELALRVWNEEESPGGGAEEAVGP